MGFTQEQLNKINYLRTSVRLQQPDIEIDPAYKFSDEDLWAILTIVTPSHNSNYTINTLPDSEFHFVVLLAKKEIYYRLATSTAPFYPLSAEGASLQKNYRFNHYMELVRQVEKDYQNSIKLALENQFGEAQSYEQLAQGWYYTRRNYNLANKPIVELTVSNITSTSVNLDWTKFNVSSGLFDSYAIYADTKPIVDEYAEIPLRQDVSAKFYTSDIHRTKYRLDGLKPDTDYYVCIISRDRNGLYGYSEKLIHTLPIS